VDVVEAKSVWLRLANPVPAFVDEECESIRGKATLLKDLHRTYDTYRREAELPRLSLQGLGRALQNLGFEMKRSAKGQVVRGLAINRQ
jgi:hypothetical protein